MIYLANYSATERDAWIVTNRAYKAHSQKSLNEGYLGFPYQVYIPCNWEKKSKDLKFYYNGYYYKVIFNSISVIKSKTNF